MPSDTDRTVLVEMLESIAPTLSLSDGALVRAVARALSEGEALRATSCRVLAEHDSGALVSEHQDAVYAMEALRRALAPAHQEREDRLFARVAREIADAAGLRPDDPPLPEHLDAAREIIRLVRAAPAALQGEQLHHPRSVAHEYGGDANHEVLSYLEAKLQIAEDANIGRVTVEVDNLRDMIAALRSTEPGGEHG